MIYANGPAAVESHGERPGYHEDAAQFPNKDAAKGESRDVVKEVGERLTQAYNFDKHNRDAAAVDLKFLAGDQWPEFARQARANRPMLTINKLPQFLHQVTNDIRKNAPVLKVTPVGAGGDENIAKIYDGIIADIQYRSSARNVYATGGYHAAACGIGHWRVKTCYQDEDTFDQEIRVELIPYPLAVYWDPAAVKPDRSDAMWCIVVDLVPTETFKLKYPGALTTSVAEVRTPSFSSGIFWRTSDYVLVAEYWCKMPAAKTLAAFESGATFDISKLNMIQLYQLQRENGQIVRKREAQSYKVEQSLVTGSEVLSGPHPWPGSIIPIVPVIGTEVPLERQVIRKGLIRDAMDAQQLYNYYRSAAAEHIALSPKSPYLVTDKMIAKHKGDWDSLSSKNKPYIRYTPDQDATGQAGKPERVQAPEPPAALWNEAEIATEDLKSTTGIYDASLGAKSNETSGVAIKHREMQGATANYHYQDNLTLSIEHTGRILIDLIPKVYDNQRVVRLMTEGGDASMVPINHVVYDNAGQPVMLNDLGVGRFDIRVTIGPSFQTKRLEGSQAMTELMGAVGNPEASLVLAPIAIRNMDIPDAEEAAEKLQRIADRILGPDPNAPPPPPSPAEQLQVAEGQAKVQQTQAQASLSTAKAEGEKINNAIKIKQLHGAHLDNALKIKQLTAPEPQTDDSEAPASQ